MISFRTVKKNVDCAVTPNQDVLSPFSEGPVETAFGDPFVYCVHAQLQKGGELIGAENRRRVRTAIVGKRLRDFGLR